MNAARMAALVALALSAAAGAAGQEVRVAVTPDTVAVGDVFHAAIRVDVPPGFRVELPDTLPVSGDLENAGRRRDLAEPLEGGGERLTFAYPLTAWRPGPIELPEIEARLVGPGESPRALDIRLPSGVVRSVLPADTAGIQPQPLKDVLGANRVWWPILVGLIFALALAAALVYWLRRRRPAAEAVLAPGIPPRERALAALDRARALGLLEAGEIKVFYSLVTDAVREFIEAVEPRWGRDLTTSELLAELPGEIDDGTRERLARLLEAADMVKFARRRPDTATALEEWQAARDWVAAFERPLADAAATAAVAGEAVAATGAAPAPEVA